MKKKLILLFLSTLFIQSSSNNFNIFKIIEDEHNPKENIINMTLGDINEGKKIFIRNLQTPCELSATSLAAMHSQDEWEAIVQAGEFEEEIIKICPKLEGEYNQTWSPSLYQFVYRYANDTGDIPTY